MTKHEVDEHLENYDSVLQADHTSDSFDLCEMFKAVRPVLIFITQSGLLKIFKPKWIAAIEKFIAANDIKCKS